MGPRSSTSAILYIVIGWYGVGVSLTLINTFSSPLGCHVMWILRIFAAVAADDPWVMGTLNTLKVHGDLNPFNQGIFGLPYNGRCVGRSHGVPTIAYRWVGGTFHQQPAHTKFQVFIIIGDTHTYVVIVPHG
eukprot:2838177-Pyramimonas_sp.AAC.2